MRFQLALERVGEHGAVVLNNMHLRLLGLNLGLIELFILALDMRRGEGLLLEVVCMLLEESD